MISQYGPKCFIYNEIMDEKDLQIDHRVPYEVGGDLVEEPEPEYFMLLSASANRAKSWACESCVNWNTAKDTSVCLTCYWAYPEDYSHIAMRQIRRIDIIWQGEEISVYDALKEQARNANKEIQSIIKEILDHNLK